jgi:hypothetical protein
LVASSSQASIRERPSSWRTSLFAIISDRRGQQPRERIMGYGSGVDLKTLVKNIGVE